MFNWSSEKINELLICFCFFHLFLYLPTDDKSILAYFFGPIGILLGINLLLFASTARQLTCGLWKREDVKSTTER